MPILNQRLAISGTNSDPAGVAFAANTRRRFTPSLVGPGTATSLRPHLILCMPAWCCPIISVQSGAGAWTFDVQNISNADIAIGSFWWYCEINNTVTFDFSTATGIGTTVLSGAVGSGAVSGSAALPIKIFTGLLEYVRINATGPVTLDQCWNGLINIDTSGGAVQVTLPTSAAITATYDGMATIFKRNGVNLATILSADLAIDGTAAGTPVQLPLDNDSMTLVYINNGGFNEWMII